MMMMTYLMLVIQTIMIQRRIIIITKMIQSQHPGRELGTITSLEGWGKEHGTATFMGGWARGLGTATSLEGWESVLGTAILTGVWGNGPIFLVDLEKGLGIKVLQGVLGKDCQRGTFLEG